MSETVSVKLDSFRKFLKSLAIISLVLAMICLATPTVSKRVQLTALGDKTIGETAAFSMALSHFAGSELSRLASQPKSDSFSKELATLLANVAERNGYEDVMLLAKGGSREYAVIADSKYRTSGVAGTDYLAAGANYPLDIYKNARTILEKIYSGKGAAAYNTSLVLRGEKNVFSTYVPVFGQGSTVLCVLAVDIAPDNISYSKLGPIDLYAVGGVLVLISAVCFLTLSAIRYFIKKRDEKSLLVAEASTEEIVPVEAVVVEESEAEHGEE